jgi:hypothetical protein
VIPRVAAALVLVAALTGCGARNTSDDPTLGTPGSASAPPSAAVPATCVVEPQHVPPPPGASTDLNSKPTVAPSTALPPQQVQVSDIVVGGGAVARPGSQVAVKYVGAFYDTGKEFDSSWARSPQETIPFSVCGSDVIPGFAVAPLGMKTGGRREVVIPSQYGYGPQGSGPIPGGATLVFVIDLVQATGP